MQGQVSAAPNGAGRGKARGRKSPTPAAPAAAAREAAVHAAIFEAFRDDTDAAFDALLAAVAAGADGASTSATTPAATAPLIDTQHPATGATALMAAAGRGRGGVVAALLTLGASATPRSTNGWTAAEWAAHLGHADVAAALAEHARAEAEVQGWAGDAATLTRYHAETDADRVDVELVQALIEYICREGRFAGGGGPVRRCFPCRGFFFSLSCPRIPPKCSRLAVPRFDGSQASGSSQAQSKTCGTVECERTRRR